MSQYSLVCINIIQHTGLIISSLDEQFLLHDVHLNSELHSLLFTDMYVFASVEL